MRLPSLPYRVTIWHDAWEAPVQDDRVHRLWGFDDQGVVHVEGGRVLRTVNPGFEDRVETLLAAAKSSGLEMLGMVPTRVDQIRPLVLEHQRYRVTYPHEWPAEMLRDACLFHLNLFVEFHRRGFDLKDGLPQNVLFEGTQPRFVDFLSLVNAGALGEIPWLVGLREGAEDLRTTVLRNMFIPYFVTPLVALEFGQVGSARTMLRDQACNVGTEAPDLRRTRPGARIRDWPRWWRRRRQVESAGSGSPETAYKTLHEAVADMRFATTSGYASYYADKNEEFSHTDTSAWFPKQHAVARALAQYRPETVLDLGCNTGWFSVLACRYGASVVAVDVDEASLNRLYLSARQDGEAITPLRLSFEDLRAETRVLGSRHTGELIFEPATSRLTSDLTLVLGLLHHLTLGDGRSFEDVLSVLADLTREFLVIEFVELADPLVSGNPGYFARLAEWDNENYAVERLVQAAAAHFDLVSVEDSHPSTRKIVTFARRTHGAPVR